MENFRIDFTLSNPFPDGKKLGECGEKNAAQLIITPPENLASREEIRSYVVAFSTDRGPVRYGPVPKAESVTVPVGNALTVGSALSVQLEGYDADGEFVIKSPVLSGIMISGSIAEGNCNPDKIVIPGHMHDNLDVIGALSDYNGTLRYNGKDIVPFDKIETVEIRSSDKTLMVIAGDPIYGSVTFAVTRDKKGNFAVPAGVEIVSVEVNIASEDEPEWVDTRDMISTIPHTPCFINQHKSFYSNINNSVIVSQLTYLSDCVGPYYEFAENFLYSSMRVKYIKKDGQE